jgi:three-Cys-motif partner protein
MEDESAEAQTDRRADLRLVDDAGPVATEGRTRRLRRTAAGAVDPFFGEQREQSRIKTEIVVKYLDAWATIMVDRYPNFKALYIDLFSGAGLYGDGEPSTPVRVLELLISNAKLAARVVTHFNEMRADTYARLRAAIANIPDLQRLQYQPVVSNEVVDEAAATALAEQHFIPSLLFADPYGYKGLTLELINAILKDWGSECIFFFNYNRIYMGLNHKGIAHHIDAIFGKERADLLRAAVNAQPRPDALAREELVLAALRDALSEIKGTYTLAFRFRRSLNKTSHYLVFVSKNVLGHDIMKGIMAGQSSSKPQGVASFEYVVQDPARGIALELETPLDDLQTELLQIYAGKQKPVKTIYDEHNFGTRYTMSNYKEALKAMLVRSAVACSRPSGAAIKNNTMPNDVVVAFPKEF